MLAILSGRALAEQQQTAAWHHYPYFFKFQAIGAPLAWLPPAWSLVACSRHRPQNKLAVEELAWRGFGFGRVRELS
jgi:hypothetical protein